MAWYHSSSSSSTHHYVESYDYEPLPYFDDDDGDVEPSIVEEHWPLDDDVDDYTYDGPGMEEDVKPTQTHPPGGGEGGAVAGHLVHDDGDVEPYIVEHYPLEEEDYLDDDGYLYGGPGVEEDVKPAAKKDTRPPRGVGGGGAVTGCRVHDYDDDAATVWYHSYSSSSTTHHYVTSYNYEPLPYIDDGEGDVRPSMVEHWRPDDDYLYEGSGVVEDVKKPAKKQQPARLAPEAKKKKAPAAAASAASGDGAAVLRSELKAKERALAQAKGKIGKLERELDKAKKRELAEARQALAFERQLGTHVLKKAEGGGNKGAAAGAKRRRRGA